MIIDTKRFSDAEFAPLLEVFAAGKGQLPVYSDSYMICPGLCDVHVHLREPGFSYKETVKTGSLAGAHGGYTALCAMPNLNPVPDSVQTLLQECEIIRRDAVISVIPYGAITVGQKGETLSEMDLMAPYVCAFSDDGKGVQDSERMRMAMLEAKKCRKIIVAHCEDESLLRGGYIHDGAYARAHGHLLGKRVPADRTRPCACCQDRSSISRMPHFNQGKRGAYSARQARGGRCDL